MSVRTSEVRLKQFLRNKVPVSIQTVNLAIYELDVWQESHDPTDQMAARRKEQIRKVIRSLRSALSRKPK